MIKQLDKYKGCFALIIVAIVWGNGFVASEIALNTMSPITILSLRFIIAAIIMLLITYKKLINITKEILFKGCILGIFLYFAFAFQTVGLQYTTPSKNAFITAVNVIIVPFIALFLDKKDIDKFGGTGALLSIVGIYLLSITKNFNINKGDLLTLICAFLFAFHIYFTGIFSKKYDFVLLATIQMSVAAIIGSMVLFISGEPFIILKSESILSIMYLGVISTALAFFMQTWGQKYTNETTAAVVLSMESVFGTLSSVVILKEILTGRMIFGSILILMGVITSETKLKFLIKKKGA